MPGHDGVTYPSLDRRRILEATFDAARDLQRGRYSLFHTMTVSPHLLGEHNAGAFVPSALTPRPIGKNTYQNRKHNSGRS